MDEQNKYLEKFYKRNLSIDEIKNIYTEPKVETDNTSTKNTVYYMTFREKIFLYLLLCGMIYKISNYLL